jgi:signal transduction protein with GAF and PtsI domain
MPEREKHFFLALYEVARVINGTLDPARVLEAITRAAARAMGVKACSLRLLDARRERLLWGAAHGLSEGYIRKGSVELKESGLDRKALTGQVVAIDDAQTDPDFQYHMEARAEGIRSVLVVPLKLDEKSIGVMRVYSSETRRFDETEIQFLECVSHLSAIAIENAMAHKTLRTHYDLTLDQMYRLDDH